MATPLDLLLQAAYPDKANSGTPYNPQGLQNAYAAAVGGNTNKGMAGLIPGNTTIEQELRTKNPFELMMDNPNVSPLDMFNYAKANNEVLRDQLASRTGSQIAADTVSGIGSGLVNSVGGLAAWGLSGIAPETSGVLSDRLGEFNEFVQDTQSPGLKAARRVVAAKNELSARDNKDLQAEDERNGASFSGLRRVGRDAIDAITNALSEPAYLGQGVSEGVGSILSGGLAGNAIKAGIKTAVPGIATTTGKLGAIGRGITEHAPMMASIGLMEGGGAYQSTYQRVMEMGLDTLSMNSKPFNDLVESGVSPEDARRQIATTAAQRAAAVQGVSGALTGSLVSRFEGNPFAAPSLGGVAGNLARETVEEGIQSGTAQWYENKAVQAYADRTTDVLEGIGQNVGEGALFGLGTAGAVQAPVGAGLTAKAAGRSAISVVGSLAGRVNNKIAKEAPVNRTEVSQAVNAFKSPEATNEATEAVNTSESITPEDKVVINEAISNINDSFSFDVNSVDSLPISDTVKENIKTSEDVIDFMYKLAGVVSDTKSDPNDTKVASTVLLSMVDGYSGFVDQFSEIINKIPEDNPARKYLSDFSYLASNISALTEVNEGMEKAVETVKQATPTITTENINTPEGQTEVNTVLAQVDHAPESVSLENVNTILKHSNQLSSRQIDKLKGIRSVIEAAQRMDAEAVSRGTTKQDQVGIQVKSDPDHPSVLSYAQNVYNSIANGSIDMAKDYLTNLGLFAEHMSNKVDAYNKHYAAGYPSQGNGQTYQQLGKDSRQFNESKRGVKVHPYREGSIDLVNTIDLEASYAANVYNSLVEAFPELGAKPFTPVSLDIDLVGNPKEVAAKFSNKANTNTPTQVNEPKPVQQEVKSEPQPTQTKEPVQTPVVEAKAPVEPIVQPVQENTEPVKGEVDTPAPVLAKGTRENSVVFNETFTVPDNSKSRVAKDDRPVDSVRSVIGSTKELESRISPRDKVKLTKAISDTYQSLLDEVGTVVEQLNKQLQERLSEKSNRIAKMLEAGNEDVLTWPEMGALNIAELRDGKWQYNQNKIEAAVMAGLQWVVNMNNLHSYPTYAEVSEQFGTNVSMEVYDFIKAGIPVSSAKESLGNKIAQYWGVRSNNNQADSLTKGIPQGVGSEILRALDNLGYVKTAKGDFIIGENIRSLSNIVPSVLSSNPEFKVIPNLLDQVVLEDVAPINYIGKDVDIPVSQTQLRTPTNKLTNKQRRVQRKAQNTVFTLVPHTAALWNALGIDNLLNMFGAGKLDAENMNENHLRSAQGKNQGITSAFDSMNNLLGDLAAESELSGDPIDQVPVRYKFEFTRVGRLMMVGSHNPQASKLMREVVTPTKSTLDLRDPNSRQSQLYFVGLAQALGIKVHNLPTDVSVSKVQDMLEGPLKPVVDTLAEWNQNQDGGLPADISKTITQAFKDAGADLGFVGLNAVLDYARLINGDKSKHSTSVYVEADGMTNGPFFAMALMSIGKFTTKWFNNIAKAGLFTEPGMTANEYRSSLDNSDLYETTANNFDKRLDSMSKEIRSIGQKELVDSFEYTRDLFDLFVKGFDKIDDKTNAISRQVTKNPLTITLYGSGSKGIAGNFFNEIADSIYERMTNVMRAKELNPDATFNESFFNEASSKEEADAMMERFVNAITFLSNTKVDITKRGIVATSVPQDNPKKSANDFTFSKGQIENIVSNINVMMIHPMNMAITDTVGSDLIDTLNTIQSATQTQGILLARLYQHKVEQANKELVEKEGKGSFISQNQQAEILNDLLRYFPTIKNADQQFFIPASDSVESGSLSYGRSLDNGYQSAPRLFGPADPSVRGIPVLVIGMGDGQMIINLADNSVVSGQSLMVYDGINFGIDTIDQGSLDANKAVWNAMQGNPVKDVHDSIKVTLNNLDRIIKDNPGFEISDKDKQVLAERSKELEYMSKSIDARRKVMNMFPWSIDQMAAVGRPYTVDNNQMVEGTDLATRMDLMNRLYESELNDAQYKDSARTVYNSIKDVLELDADNQKVMDTILKSGALDEYTITFNPTAEYGSVDFNTKNINISSLNSETVFHELLHASSFVNTLNGLQPNADPTLKALVRSTERLMNDFLKIDSKDDSVITAKDVIRDLLAENTIESKAAAINEFMAWGLSNESIRNTLRANKTSKLAALSKKVMEYLKRILFGSKHEDIRDDMLYQLGFNTRGIIESQPSISTQFNDVRMFHNPAYGTNERLSELEGKWFNKLLEGLPTNNTDSVDMRIAQPLQRAYEAAKSVEAHGFNMTMQEAGAFRNIVAALSSDVNIDPVVMVQAQELYTHVINNTLPNAKYHTLLGTFFKELDSDGRSYILPIFLGLASVHEGFREELSRMELPKKMSDYSTVDNALESLAGKAMDYIADSISRNSGDTVGSSVDALANKLVEIAQDRKDFISEAASVTGNGLDRANEIVVDGLKALSGKAYTTGESLLKSDNNGIKGLGATLQLLSSIASEETGAVVSEGVQKAINKSNLWEPFTKFVSDLIGRTKSNASVYDMIKASRSMAQQIRQVYREKLPNIIASKFSTKPTEEQMQSLYKTIGKSDLAAVASVLGKEEALKVLADPSERSNLIQSLEASITNASPFGSRMITKSKELALFMVKGEISPNLLRNATAISKLLGERQGVDQIPERSLVKDIDVLVSLYALNHNEQSDLDILSSLIGSDKDGISFVLDYMKGQKAGEAAKQAKSNITDFNEYKGFIPSTQTGSTTIVMKPLADAKKLRLLGFTMVQQVSRELNDGMTQPMAYFVSPVSGKSPYSQGILQTVRDSVNGVNPETGYTVGNISGVVANPTLVSRIAANPSSITNLVPVFDTEGNVRAYERITPKEISDLVVRDNNLAKEIGVWRGRQVEEELASKINTELLHNLHDMFTNAPEVAKGNKEGFIDILSTKLDPVHQKVQDMLSTDIKDQMRSISGDNTFFIRKDMIDDALGYPAASVSDIWTGTSRYSESTQKVIKDLLTTAFGVDTYKKLVQAEKFVQNVVLDAKTLIVVKSVIVPVVNIISNGLQLIGRGVPIANISKAIPHKLTEINYYTSQRVRQVEAEAELRAASTDPNVSRRLEAEIQSIKDSYKRLSIWPLIEAGEFTSVSDAAVGKEDILLSEGKLTGYIEGLVEKLPEKVRNAGRYAIISKDTALFKGLQRSVDYGDFIAKAIIYDDLVNRKGLTREQALGRVTEEFVNYDRLTGRFRQYLESMGLLWFYNFKIRSSKIALSMIRNNPLHTLMASMVPLPDAFSTVGLPTEDSLVPKLFEGKLGYSIGIGQGINSPFLNPWVAMTN